MAITPKSSVDIPNTTGIITPITPATTSLANARIGYKNLLTATTTSGAQAMLTPNTWERFVPQGSPFNTPIKFQFPELTQIDYIAIGAHNLYSGLTSNNNPAPVAITLSYATSIGGTPIQIETLTPDSDDALMVLFDAVNAHEIILSFTTFAESTELGVIYSGKSLEMERPIFGGHSPAVLNANTQYQSTISESGQFLGRTITRQGVEASYSWRHLTSDWYRSEFQPFVQAARKTPFFIKWRPDTYEDTVFGHTTGDISPTIMTGGSRLMEVSFKIKGHQDINA